MIREKGFTVVELLAVLAILSIILSISFPSLRSVIAN
ncbi:prepilin-type N-terminal cleavage/methylation domain-containing protein [Alkalibacterium indicireducens]